MTKTEIMQFLEITIGRDKADSCAGCAFLTREDWEMPCKDCKRSHKDYWRMAEVSKWNQQKQKI